MNKEKIWNLFLLFSVILIIHGMSNSGDVDKKTAQVAQGEATAGSIGVVAFAIKKTNPLIAVAAILLPLFLAPSLISTWIKGISNWFSPQPTIPVFVWVVGFFILMLIVLKKN